MPTRPLSRRAFLRLAAYGGLAVAAGRGVVAEPWFPALERVAVSIPRLPSAFEGFTILHLSDIHHSNIVPRAQIERAVEAGIAERPDLVALTGDFVSTARLQPGSGIDYAEPCAAILAPLADRAVVPMGAFAVLGNHDFDTDPSRVTRALEARGIRVLADEHLFLERGGERLRIAGVADFWRAPDRADALTRTLAGRGEDEPVVMLAHNPDQFPELAAAGVSLTLSGHTHGGQVRIPGWGPLWVPSRFGDRYAQGLIEENGSRLYVTRGVGTLIVPFRFACPAEVTLLTLHAA